MKTIYDHVEFTYPDKASLESFKALFAKIKEYKNLSIRSDTYVEDTDEYREDNTETYGEDVDWKAYLTETAEEWFSHPFDFRSEEGEVYLKLWDLTPPAIRSDSSKLIPPGHADFDSTMYSIINCEYGLISIEEENSGEEKTLKAILYIEFWSFPFGGMESMWELLRAFGFEITFDSYYEDRPPFNPSEWDYELAKKLVKQNKGLE